MLLRVLGKSVAAGVLAAATLLVGVGGVAAASGGTQLPAPAVQGQPAYWMALKASLDKDTSLSRTVTVVGSLRLLTYTSASGISFVLAEPTGHGSLSVKPDLGVVQCAAWSFCLRLNRTDHSLRGCRGDRRCSVPHPRCRVDRLRRDHLCSDRCRLLHCLLWDLFQPASDRALPQPGVACAVRMREDS
jgi:hypothetical protein